MIQAWHFVGKTLRDGLPVPQDGEWLEVSPPVELCVRGLHASLEPFDAFQYATGDTLCLVDIEGEIMHGPDKLVATRRRIVKRMDATELLRYFARMQALSVIHLWDAPEVVLNYLMTGDESSRKAAYFAYSASDAAYAATNSANAACAAANATNAASAATNATNAAYAATAINVTHAAYAATAAYFAYAADAAAEASARKDFNALVYECFEE